MTIFYFDLDLFFFSSLNVYYSISKLIKFEYDNLFQEDFNKNYKSKSFRD